ncbi:Uncharacterised protein [Chlamydia trachomatis]|nr:Uncharacterised protein [Chlamydia trachomatis]
MAQNAILVALFEVLFHGNFVDKELLAGSGAESQFHAVVATCKVDGFADRTSIFKGGGVAMFRFAVAKTQVQVGVGLAPQGHVDAKLAIVATQGERGQLNHASPARGTHHATGECHTLAQPAGQLGVVIEHFGFVGLSG